MIESAIYVLVEIGGFVTGFCMRFCRFGLRLCHGYVGLGRVARRKALLYTLSASPTIVAAQTRFTWTRL
jgi:hypothetical protein